MLQLGGGRREDGGQDGKRQELDEELNRFTCAGWKAGSVAEQVHVALRSRLGIGAVGGTFWSGCWECGCCL